MSEPVKAALIIAAAIIGGVAVWTFFSPYQTCVRAEKARDNSRAEIQCAAAVSGSR